MAPIKFEEQLKDKLEKRSLQPSAESWAKLSERLDAEEKKSKNPWFWWMGIAAGLIIMVAVAVQSFSSKDAKDNNPVLVEEDKDKSNIEPLKPYDTKINNTELAVEELESKEEKVDQSTHKQPKIINYKSVTKQKPSAKSQLASTNKPNRNKEEKEPIENLNYQLIDKEAKINTKVLTKAIEEFKTNRTSVTDKEVDSLLKLASKELFRDKLQKETAKTVDARSLLDEVEEDMGQSFRSKVFDALKDSYKAVKTKVAERNN